MSVEKDIEAELEAEGIAGSGTDWSIHGYDMPSDPDKVVLVTPTPGLEPQAFSETDLPRFQVRVRAGHNETADARSKINDVYRHFRDKPKGTINGVSYGGIRAVQQPSWLRTDDADRHEFVVNFEALKETV